MAIIFPRPTLRIGKCLAVICTYRKQKLCEIGEPILHRRPVINYEGKFWQGHRLAFRLNVGKIPRQPRSLKTGLILHSCDHDWCIDPLHLYKGTQKNNMRDLSNRHPTIRKIRSNNMIGKRYSLGRKQTRIEKLRRAKGVARAWANGKFVNRDHQNQWTKRL